MIQQTPLRILTPKQARPKPPKLKLPKTPLVEYLDFLRAFAAKPRLTGALLPSSRELGRMMIRGFDLKKAGLVVEIGPGTGAFTRVILDALGDPARYMAVELNGEFVRRLSLKFPQARFYQGSAEHVGSFVAEHGGARKADYVVCGLPWAMFPPELQDRILHGITGVLRPGGRFSTFTYLHALQLPAGRRFRRRLRRAFRTVRLSPVVWKNFPPAVAYHCIR